jgi:hypothetical protein
MEFFEGAQGEVETHAPDFLLLWAEGFQQGQETMVGAEPSS